MIPFGKTIACDTETTGVNSWLGDRPFCFTFCNERGDTGYYYWPVNPKNRQVKINPTDLWEMKRFFADKSVTKVFHNAKFDLLMLESIGIKVKGPIEDTLLAAYCLRTNELTFALKPLAKKYLDFSDDDEKELQDQVKRRRIEARNKGYKIADGSHGRSPIAADYWLADREMVLKYATGDVERTILLWKIFRHLMKKDDAIRNTYYNYNVALIRPVMKMEKRGVRVNREIVLQKIKHHNKIIKDSLSRIQKATNPKFNPGSSKQVADLIYNKLGFWCSDYTEKGSPMTGSKILRKFKHPIIDDIIKHQSSQKAISTFYENFLLHAVWNEEQKEYILHPWYNLNGTATGRLSCSNPNLQNVADANTTQALVPEQAREPFGPRKGCVWISIDYSGEELWIYANNSRDEDMLHELRKGSPHLKTARAVWPDEQSDDEKKGAKVVYKRAKILLFSIIFGSGVKGIVSYHNLPYEEANRVHKGIHKTYPGIQKFIDNQTILIRKTGYIVTPYGRKIFADPDMGYKSANYSVQGTAGDVMKKIIIKLTSFFQKNEIPIHILMTIHDELIMEIPKDILSQKLVKQIIHIMEDQPELLRIKKLPVGVALITENWGKKEEIKDLRVFDEKTEKQGSHNK